MSYRLQGDNLEYFMQNNIGVNRWSGCRIKFNNTSASSGSKIANILRTCYGEFIRWFDKGIDYEDFNLVTKTSAGGKFIEDDIRGAVEKYNKEHSYQTPIVDPDETTTLTPEEPEGKGMGTYTYIIIGAAVIILILLLWDKKKK